MRLLEPRAPADAIDYLPLRNALIFTYYLIILVSLSMPLSMASSNPQPLDASFLTIPYPAKTKQAAGMVDGILTNVMAVSFADKILVTIIQGGRLAQWVSPANSLLP